MKDTKIITELSNCFICDRFWHLSTSRKLLVTAFENLENARKTRGFGELKLHAFYICYTLERSKLLGIVVPVYKNILYVRQLPVSPSVLSFICSELYLYVTSFSAWNFVDFCWIFYTLIILKPEGARNTSASGKVAGFPQRRAEFSTRSVRVGLMVDKMALRHVFPKYFSFACPLRSPPSAVYSLSRYHRYVLDTDMTQKLYTHIWFYLFRSINSEY